MANITSNHLNRLLVLHTPKKVLEHFRNGTYETNLTKQHSTSNFMSWKRTKRWIKRALACDCGYPTHQQLNTNPLAETFLDIYNKVNKTR